MAITVPITLSKLKPDFESILLQLQLYLSAKATWSDMLTSSTGETLLEIDAACAAFNQYAIESAARESFLITARRSSSIYALTRTLGVRIGRKAPTQTPVTLTRSAPSQALLIPKYTQFYVGGVPYFNRSSLLFDAGVSEINTTLYQGTISVQTISADSTIFREVFLNEPDFVVSDSDVQVKVVNPADGTSEIWTPTDEGIWSLGPYDASYYDATTGDGDVVLTFGDGYHGKLPSVGYNIEITYAVTVGSEANSALSDVEVNTPTYSTVKGKSTGPSVGGADEKKASYYKVLAPKMYRARSRAVIRGDYSAQALSYPEAASVVVKAQAEIAPSDLRWMNTVRVCVLPFSSDAFTDAQWEDFLTYMKRFYHAAIHIQRYNPTRIAADISIVLALKPTALPADVEPSVILAVRALFEKNYDTLGKRISLHDIHQACQVDGVDYVIITLPPSDLVPQDEYTWISLNSLSVISKYSERVWNQT